MLVYQRVTNQNVNLTGVEWNFTKKTGDFSKFKGDDPGVMGNQWFSQPGMMNLATGMILPITRCKVVPS